jgi:hypothetical protein
LADGILLERAGVPAVSVCTDVFKATAGAMAQVYGFPGFEYVTVPHPIASLDAAQLRARAEEAVPGVLAILSGE